jgi:hypothetical protein
MRFKQARNVPEAPFRPAAKKFSFCPLRRANKIFYAVSGERKSAALTLRGAGEKSPAQAGRPISEKNPEPLKGTGERRMAGPHGNLGTTCLQGDEKCSGLPAA